MSGIVPLTLGCILTFTNHYHFPRETLFALLAQEAGTLGETSTNRNGTHDYGPYQVNDVNVPTIARHFGLPQDVARERLRDDGCFNVEAAAYLLNQHYQETGDIKTAIGFYHSKTPALAEKYLNNVYAKARQLYEYDEVKRNRKRQ